LRFAQSHEGRHQGVIRRRARVPRDRTGLLAGTLGGSNPVAHRTVGHRRWCHSSPTPGPSLRSLTSAFLPFHQSRNQGLFLDDDAALAAGTLSFGAIG
jgi:hypothetical protein